MQKSNNFWVGSFPDRWEERKASHFFQAKKGGQAAKLTKEYCHEQESIYPVYSGQTENQGVMGEIDSFEFEYNEGVILSTTVGANAMSATFITGRFSLSQNCMILIPKDEEAIEPKYFYHLFTRQFAVEKSKIPSHMQPSFRMEDFYRFKILIPPPQEQTQIARYLDYKTAKIDALIAKKQRLIELLIEERTAIINQAVTKGLNPDAPMKDSGIEWLGEIPEHWVVKKLKYLFSFNKGLSITKSDLLDEGMPCINYGEIHSKYGFEVDTSKHRLKYVDEAVHEKSESAILQSGDFVFADTSEDVEGAGNFSYNSGEQSLFAGYHTVVVRPKVGLNSRFFAFLFHSLNYRTQTRREIKGVKVFSITQSMLKNESAWFPSIEEQEEIAQYLTGHDDRITKAILKTTQEIELLKEYKTALISEVVTGKVDVRDEVIPE